MPLCSVLWLDFSSYKPPYLLHLAIPTTDSPTIFDPPTETPTISPAPTALQGKPEEEAAAAIEQKVVASRGRMSEVLLQSEYPHGTNPSYIYNWKSFAQGLKMMTTGTGPGQGNWFYIGEANTLDYGEFVCRMYHILNEWWLRLFPVHSLAIHNLQVWLTLLPFSLTASLNQSTTMPAMRITGSR